MLIVTKILFDKMGSQAESKRPSMGKPIFSDWQEMRQSRPCRAAFAPPECVFPQSHSFPLHTDSGDLLWLSRCSVAAAFSSLVVRLANFGHSSLVKLSVNLFNSPMPWVCQGFVFLVCFLFPSNDGSCCLKPGV